jgi:hypothetical protein
MLMLLRQNQPRCLVASMRWLYQSIVSNSSIKGTIALCIFLVVCVKFSYFEQVKLNKKIGVKKMSKKRTKYTSAFKTKLVLELLQNKSTLVQIASKHSLNLLGFYTYRTHQT